MPARTLAKLSRPRLLGTVPRERLFELLDEGLRRPLTLVVGPPGAGKTTLLASYVDERQRPALWYHVDSGDDDPASFFSHMRRACSQLAPRQRTLPLFTSEYLSDVEGFTRRFFRALFARLPDRAIVALDNIHSVTDDSVLHRILTIAVAEAPKGAAVVTLSRKDAPPPYAHLLANDLVARINGEALMLTESEIRQLVVRKYQLQPDAAATLLRRTRGWPAGVTLLAQHWRDQDGTPNRQSEVTVQSVADYFETQIMQGLSRAERDALERVAVLPTVTLRAATVLSGSDIAGPLLERLHRLGLFTERQAGNEPRYRYHDLFRDFLRDALRSSLSPGHWHRMLATAARVAASAGDLEAAMPLLLEVRDIGTATHLIRSQARELLAEGRFRTLRGWIEGLGEHAPEGDPWLRYWLGHSFMPTDIASARSAFECAFRQFAGAGDRVGQLAAAAQVINTWYYQYSDYAPMAPWVARIDGLLKDAPVLPDPASDADLCTALIFAATWLGHVDERTFVGRAEALLLNSSLEPNLKVCLGYALADFYTVGSRMADSRRVFDLLAPLLADPRVTALNRAYAHLQLGYHFLRSGEHAAAESAWRTVDSIAEEHGLKDTELVARLFRSFSKSCQLDVLGAEAQLRGLEPAATEGQPLTGALYHVACVLLELARCDGRAAARHARLSLRHAERLGGGFVNVAWRAHGSAALAMAGEYQDADRWIEEGLAQARGSWLECYRTNLLMSRAYSLLLQGERERGHSVIRELMRLARENEWWTYLRIVPHVKDTVLLEAIRAGIELPFAQKLARAFRARPGADPPANWPWPIRVYTLGGFRLVIDGVALAFARKAQKRPLALLKAVIAMGGRGVDTQRLAAFLWPGSDGDDADDALAMAAHRLRKLVDCQGGLVIRDGKCWLDPDAVWVDVWALERLLDRIEVGERNRLPVSGAELGELLELYRGHFLEREPEEAWLLPLQQRLRGRLQRAVAALGGRLEAEERWDEAAAIYERGIELDPLAERLYRGLIQCHNARGRLADAREAYRRCRHMLSIVLGTKPSAETQSLFDSLPGAPGLPSVSDP